MGQAGARPEVVAICPRYADEHFQMTMSAIQSGTRALYVEKPFCRSLTEADAIIAACAQRNVKCAVAHRTRYHPVLPVVAGMLKEKAIGRFLEIRARGKEDERGGPLDLWVLGSHVLNVAHHFAGKPVACSAVLLQQGRPATRQDVKEGGEGVGPVAGNEVHARFEMESGIPVFFESIERAGSRAAGFGLQLIGTEGIIDFRLDQEPLAQFLQGNPFLPKKEARAWVPISSAGPGKPEPITDLMEQFKSHRLPGRDLLAALRENRQPLCSAEDGRVTVEMILGIFESHRLEGRRVTFPLQTRENPLTLLQGPRAPL